MATRASRSKTRQTPTQARAARRARRNSRRRLLRLGAFTAVGLVAGAFVISLFLPSITLNFNFSDLFSSVDHSGERIPSQGREHIQPGADHAAYNSIPATSGPHFSIPLAPARWGVHGDVLADEVLIHNLEHGGIGVNYDCPDGCEELVEQLAGIVDRAVDGGLKVIMSPYPDLVGARIALTAWTVLDKFDVFDEDRINDFIRALESSSDAPEPNAR